CRGRRGAAGLPDAESCLALPSRRSCGWATVPGRRKSRRTPRPKAAGCDFRARRGSFLRLYAWFSGYPKRIHHSSLECLLEHLERGLERGEADVLAAPGTEVLLPVARRTAAPRAAEMHEAFLVVLPARAGKARDRQREVGVRAAQRALGHGQRDLAADRAVRLDHAAIEAEQLALGVVGIDHEAALERVAA